VVKAEGGGKNTGVKKAGEVGNATMGTGGGGVRLDYAEKWVEGAVRGGLFLPSS